MLNPHQQLCRRDSTENLQKAVRIASTCIDNYQISIRDYELNVGKSIDKKLLATSRPFDFEVDEKKQSTVITCSAAAYELLKIEIGRHYINGIKKGEVVVKEGMDKSNNKIDISVQVEKKNQSYTINLYNTTSRLMVNGRHYKRFKKEFDLIKEALSNAPLSEMNDSLRQQLLKAQECLERNNFLPLPEPEPDEDIISNNQLGRRQSARNTKKSIIWDPSNPNTGDENTAKTVNPLDCVCGNPVLFEEKALECDKCRIWIHMCCDSVITPTIYEEHQKDPSKPYLCPMCEYDHLYEISKTISESSKGKSDNKSLIKSSQKQSTTTVSSEASKGISSSAAKTPATTSVTTVHDSQTASSTIITTHSPHTTSLTPRTSTGPTTTSTTEITPHAHLPSYSQEQEKEIKQRLKETKKWQTDMSNQAKNMVQVASQLAAARMHISQLEKDLHDARTSDSLRTAAAHAQSGTPGQSRQPPVADQQHQQPPPPPPPVHLPPNGCFQPPNGCFQPSPSQPHYPAPPPPPGYFPPPHGHGPVQPPPQSGGPYHPHGYPFQTSYGIHPMEFQMRDLGHQNEVMKHQMEYLKLQNELIISRLNQSHSFLTTPMHPMMGALPGAPFVHGPVPPHFVPLQFVPQPFNQIGNYRMNRYIPNPQLERPPPPEIYRHRASPHGFPMANNNTSGPHIASGTPQTTAPQTSDDAVDSPGTSSVNPIIVQSECMDQPTETTATVTPQETTSPVSSQEITSESPKTTETLIPCGSKSPKGHLPDVHSDTIEVNDFLEHTPGLSDRE